MVGLSLTVLYSLIWPGGFPHACQDWDVSDAVVLRALVDNTAHAKKKHCCPFMLSILRWKVRMGLDVVLCVWTAWTLYPCRPCCRAYRLTEGKGGERVYGVVFYCIAHDDKRGKTNLS